MNFKFCKYQQIVETQRKLLSHGMIFSVYQNLSYRRVYHDVPVT